MDGEEKSVNKQESRGDKSESGSRERSARATDSLNKSAIDGQKIVSFDKKWKQSEYREEIGNKDSKYKSDDNEKRASIKEWATERSMERARQGDKFEKESLKADAARREQWDKDMRSQFKAGPDASDQSANKRESRGDKSVPGSGERSARAADNLNKSAIDGQKIVILDRKWTQSEYRKLSPEARKKVDDTANAIFSVREPGFDAKGTGRKLDDKNPEDKPFVEKWLRIRDELMIWGSKDGKTGKQYWEGEAAKDKQEIKEWRKEMETVPRETAQKTVLEKQEKPVQVLGKTDHGQIKATIQEIFSKTGPKFDRVTTALNITRDLKDSDIASLKKTREGLDTLLILNGVLAGSKEAGHQTEAQRLLFSDTSLPPKSLSSLEMSQGILREGRDGKGFLKTVHDEFDQHKGDEAKASLNLARRLTNEHIRVARETPEGLKGITEIRRWLATGSFDGKDKADAEKQLNRISEALVPGSVPEKTRTVDYGSLDYRGSGRELHNFIKNELANESSRETAAINISRGLSDENLKAALKNPEGKKGVLSVYRALVDGNSEDAKLHGNRILNALQAMDDPGKLEKKIEDGKVPVFPVRMTYWNSAKPFATLTEDGKINVTLSDEARTSKMFEAETKTLEGPTDVFLYRGHNFKPEEIVGIKVYPEQTTIYRPAAYLLNINKLSVSDTIGKAIDAGSIGLGGPVPKGQIFKGALGMAERGVAGASRALWGASVVVNENKEWLIEKYGDTGRNFIQVMDRAKQYVEIYGMARAISSPVAEKLTASWNDLKGKGSTADSSKLTALKKEMETFDTAVAAAKTDRPAGRTTASSQKETPVDPFARTERMPVPAAEQPVNPFARAERRQHLARESAAGQQERLSTTQPPEAKEARPAADRPTTEPPAAEPAAKVNRWRTFMEFQPGKFGYKEYLGEDLFKRAQQMGMDNDTLFRYVDAQIYPQELLKHTQTRDFTGLKEGVQQTIGEHLTKLESVGAQSEIKRGIENGLNPWQIVDDIDKFRSQGLSDNQIRRQLQKQNEYIDYLKRDLCGNDTVNVRAALQAAEGDIGVAVSNREYSRKLKEWNDNPDRRGIAPGSKLMTKWAEQADLFARSKTREYMNRP